VEEREMILKIDVEKRERVWKEGGIVIPKDESNIGTAQSKTTMICQCQKP
jgi:hypothetical protein